MTNEMYKKLGVIGGLGPAATARFYERLVDFTKAATDQDHLDVTILSRPQIPDRTAYLLGEPDAVSFIEPMQQAALELESLGCEVLCTPCNTAHARLNEISRPLSSSRFVDMLDEVACISQRLGCRKLGILATLGTRKAHIYDDACAAWGIEAVWPDEQEQKHVTDVIFSRVKAGKPASEHVLDEVFDALIDAGCDGIVLGCTELSVLGCPQAYRYVYIIDALDVLAQRCVLACNAPAYPICGISEDCSAWHQKAVNDELKKQ